MVASIDAHAQEEPPTSPAPVDPAIRDRTARIGLGTLASLGTASAIIGFPMFITAFAASSSSSGNVLVGTLTTSAIAAIALAPLAYAGAGSLTNGRSTYLAALGGMLGGAVLGFIPIPIGLTGPSWAMGPYIVASSVLVPVLGLAGQALTYELTQRSARISNVAGRSAPRMWPSFAVSANSATLAFGGPFG